MTAVQPFTNNQESGEDSEGEPVSVSRNDNSIFFNFPRQTQISKLQELQDPRGLEYQGGNGSTETSEEKNKSRRRKNVPSSHQSQGSVVKVAMIGEFAMSNFHQCS